MLQFVLNIFLLVVVALIVFIPLNIYLFLLRTVTVSRFKDIGRLLLIIRSQPSLRLFACKGDEIFLVYENEEFRERLLALDPASRQIIGLTLKLSGGPTINSILDQSSGDVHLAVPVGARDAAWRGGNMTARRLKKRLWRLLILKLALAIVLYSPIAILPLAAPYSINTIAKEAGLLAFYVIFQFFPFYVTPKFGWFERS